MRGSNRYLTGKTMTVAAFAVQDWSISTTSPTVCFDCGEKLDKKKPRVCPIMGELLCEFCYQYRLDQKKEMDVLDDLDRMRDMGVEPPRALIDHFEEQYWD